MKKQKPPAMLPPDDARIAEAAAQLTIQLLRNEGHVAQMLTAAEVAARLRVERGWVYRHSEELGSIRLGEGPNAPVRFPADRVAAFTAPSDSLESETNERATAAKRRRRGRGLTTAGALLPYRGHNGSTSSGE